MLKWWYNWWYSTPSSSSSVDADKEKEKIKENDIDPRFQQLRNFLVGRNLALGYFNNTPCTTLKICVTEMLFVRDDSKIMCLENSMFGFMPRDLEHATLSPQQLREVIQSYQPTPGVDQGILGCRRIDPWGFEMPNPSVACSATKLFPKFSKDIHCFPFRCENVWTVKNPKNNKDAYAVFEVVFRGICPEKRDNKICAACVLAFSYPWKNLTADVKRLIYSYCTVNAPNQFQDVISGHTCTSALRYLQEKNSRLQESIFIELVCPDGFTILDKIPYLY